MTNSSGKQNSFAGQILPSTILIECKREKLPVNLVNAFAEPVRSNAEGTWCETAFRALWQEAEQALK